MHLLSGDPTCAFTGCKVPASRERVSDESQYRMVIVNSTSMCPSEAVPGRRPVVTLSTAVRRSVLIGAFAAATGCGGPSALEVEPPEAQGPPPEADSLPVSRISVPVTISVETLQRVVERELPQRLGDLNDRRPVGENDRLDAAFEVERGGIDATFDGGVAQVSATLGYRVRAWYDPPVLPAVSASCGTEEGEPLPRLDASVASPLTLDRAWRIQSSVRLQTLAPASDLERDRCTMTVFDFDVTRHVVDGTREALAEVGAKADSAIASLDVRSDFEEWWDVIARPIELEEDIWLFLDPRSAGHGSFEGDGSDVRTVLSVQVAPRIHLGPKPDVAAISLPPLDSAGVNPMVDVRAAALAPWGEVTRRVSSEFVGESFSAGGRRLRVDDIGIGGVGDGRIFLELRLSGDVEGTVFLVGTPTYESGADEIHVPDLDFDVRTEEALVESAAWIAEVGLLPAVRDRARWSMTEVREWARRQAERGFNSEISSMVALSGAVDEVTIEDVLATAEALRIVARVRGRAELLVDAR